MKERSGMKISTFKDRFALLCDENSGSLTTLADTLHVSKQTVSVQSKHLKSFRALQCLIFHHFHGIRLNPCKSVLGDFVRPKTVAKQYGNIWKKRTP